MDSDKQGLLKTFLKEHNIVQEDLDAIRRKNSVNSDQLFFSVDASHLKRIGYELVTKQETAVAELIKNAYDADATEVTLTFVNPTLHYGELIIEDNGSGMDRTALIEGFMRLSTTAKIHQPRSPLYHRSRAGRKGIGRFAVHRLGKKLELTTRANGMESALRISADWESFSEKKELSSIGVPLAEVEADFEKGTRIHIKELRDTWTVSQIERAYRYVLELQNPFPVEKLNSASKDSGFDVRFKIKEGLTCRDIVNKDIAVLDHALAIFEGRIAEDGVPDIKITSKRYGLSKESIHLDEYKSTLNGKHYPDIAGLEFKAYYYIAQSKDSEDLLPRNLKNPIAQLLKEKGGIKLYKNNFRVPPYGDARDDWLNLDSSSRSRQILPPHGNENFFGYVNVDSIEGEAFTETASREGVISNQAFEQTQEFVSSAIKACVLRVASLRDKKGRAGDKPKTKKSASDKIEDAFAEYENTKRDNSNETPETAEASLDALKHNVIETIEETERTLIQETEMLRVLASLGINQAFFTHELQSFLARIRGVLSGVEADNQDAKNPIINNLKNLVTESNALTEYFYSAFQANASREKETADVRHVIVEFKEAVTAACEKKNITLITQIKGYDLYTVPIHQSEWISILSNLLTNAFKAIHRENPVEGKRNVLVEALQEHDEILIRFSDTGDGIEPSKRDDVFLPFYTTSRQENEVIDYASCGLGLTLIKQIIEGVGGEIGVVDPESGYSTTFQITLPAKEGVLL